MDFPAIDRARAEAGIEQKVLCRRAKVDPSTYSQIKLGRRGAYVRTVSKLNRALAELIAEKGETDGRA